MSLSGSLSAQARCGDAFLHSKPELLPPTIHPTLNPVPLRVSVSTGKTWGRLSKQHAWASTTNNTSNCKPRCPSQGLCQHRQDVGTPFYTASLSFYHQQYIQLLTLMSLSGSLSAQARLGDASLHSKPERLPPTIHPTLNPDVPLRVSVSTGKTWGRLSTQQAWTSTTNNTSNCKPRCPSQGLCQHRQDLGTPFYTASLNVYHQQYIQL